MKEITENQDSKEIAIRLNIIKSLKRDKPPKWEKDVVKLTREIEKIHYQDTPKYVWEEGQQRKGWMPVHLLRQRRLFMAPQHDDHSEDSFA